MPKVLFIAAHRPDRSPSQRFRFEQYIPFLEENGFACDFSYLIAPEDDAYFYKSGHFLKKALFTWKSWMKRKRDQRRYSTYDIVFVQREAYMLGSTYFERKIRESGAKMIFDFDDSIWLMDTSKANKKFEFLKDPSKTSKNISYADLVFAGNQYLANYALQFNNNVVIIPTTIDTSEYKPVNRESLNRKIVIGWSGSITTIKHFEYALEFLEIIHKKYGDKIEIKVIGDKTYRNQSLGIVGLPWKKETEVADLNSFDIGIMPLPDDEWAKGKCGLKGLQYMALEIPTIMSPVGVNSEIIQHGSNGFLATTTEEWVNCLSKLIENHELRQAMGRQARATVLDKYSVESQKGRYLEYFRQVLRK